MSNIVDINELRKEFLKKTDAKEIKEFVHKQQELLEYYMKEVQVLKDKLTHSEMIIKQMGSSLTIMPSDEELLCIEQIKILKEKSSNRELDVNDVKKLDLLIKNLRLIRSQPTDTIDVTNKNISEEDLIAAAIRNSEDK